MDWLARHETRSLTAVAIAPDLGERYLDTLYRTTWLQDVYGTDLLDPDELATREPAIRLTNTASLLNQSAAR
jgi:cysteine synthase A